MASRLAAAVQVGRATRPSRKREATIPHPFPPFRRRLQVGRVDRPRDATLEEVRAVHATVPGEFSTLGDIMSYMAALSGDIRNNPPPGVREGETLFFAGRDTLALLGGHTLMDNQGCSTADCGGSVKSLNWTNDFYHVRPRPLCTDACGGA